MKAKPSSLTFIVLMSLLGGMSALATDMGLAATEPMASDLAVTTGRVGLALSAFMLSFALSPLVYGPLSDRYGRRPVALFACFIYVVGGIGCLFAHNLAILMGWRFVQGFGGGARPLALAIIGDNFKGAAAREKMSYVNALSVLAPLLAPTIGAALLGFGGWRLISVFLAATGAVAFVFIWLRLEESLPAGTRSTLSPRSVAAHYASVFRNPGSLANTIISVAMFGVIFGYVSGSPLVMIGAFKLTPAQYGATFALNSAGLLIGSLTNARLNKAGLPPRTLLTIGLALVVANVLALLALTWLGNTRIEPFLPFLVLCMVGCSIGNTNAIQLAMEPLPLIAGTASAAVVSTQLAFGAVAGFLVSEFYDGHTAFSTVSTMAVFAIVGLVGFFLRPPDQRLGRIGSGEAEPFNRAETAKGSSPTHSGLAFRGASDQVGS